MDHTLLLFQEMHHLRHFAGLFGTQQDSKLCPHQDVFGVKIAISISMRSFHWWQERIFWSMMLRLNRMSLARTLNGRMMRLLSLQHQ